MSVTVEAIVNNQSYPLSGGNPWWFVSMTGGGIPPVRRIKERSPMQHGSTDVGFLLDERMINLVLLLEATGATTAEALALADEYREELCSYLMPRADTPISLRVTRDNGSQRQVDCNVVGPVDFPITLRERMGPSQLVVVQFEAADPIPYEPLLNNITFTLATGAGAPGGFAVPLHVPLESTVTSNIDDVEVLVYTGKWEVFPIIYLTGPAENAKITNNTTGRVLDFTGHNIASGDTYIVDLRYGRRRVVDQNGVLKNSALTDESDLHNWSLVPAPISPGGINEIRVEVPSGVTGATKIRIEYYNRYLSLT